MDCGALSLVFAHILDIGPALAPHIPVTAFVQTAGFFSLCFASANSALNSYASSSGIFPAGPL